MKTLNELFDSILQNKITAEEFERQIKSLAEAKPENFIQEAKGLIEKYKTIAPEFEKYLRDVATKQH